MDVNVYVGRNGSLAFRKCQDRSIQNDQKGAGRERQMLELKAYGSLQESQAEWESKVSASCQDNTPESTVHSNSKCHECKGIA
eukprot:6265384-Amphidinium_carterae.1